MVVVRMRRGNLELSRKSEKGGEEGGRETEEGDLCFFVVVFDGFHGLKMGIMGMDNKKPKSISPIRIKYP